MTTTPLSAAVPATSIGGDDSLRSLRILERHEEADGIVSLRLGSDGRPLPRWEPGAHIDVHLGNGLVRQYSLSSLPEENTWRIAVLREQQSTGGSDFVHDTLRPGGTVTVGMPRNNFPLRLSPDRHVFVAGGIGITPILPMIAAAEAAGADWRLLYLTRSASATAFSAELDRYGDRVVRHHDDTSGIVDLTSVLDGLEPADLQCCGPAGLLTALESYAAERPDVRLTLERFVADAELLAQVHRDGDSAFTVELSDGTEVGVPAGCSILDAMRRAGIQTLSSCQEGICGTCETPVLEGEPDHRDQVLTDDERAANETMMICVSRCRGDRLVLDL